MTEFRIIFEKPTLTIGAREYQQDARSREILDRFMEQYGYTGEEVAEVRFTATAAEVDVLPAWQQVCRFCHERHLSYFAHTVRHNLVDGSLSLDGA